MDQAIPRKGQELMKKERTERGRLRTARIIRGCTAPPFCALIMLLLLFFFRPGFFHSASNFAFAIVYLFFLPVLAYPVSLVFKFPKDSFRNNQRKLAVIFSVIGYAALLAMVLKSGFYNGELVVYLNYVISGALIAITTPIPHCKASGHACGVAGPIASLVYFISPWYIIPGVLLLAAVFWSSLKLKRHTLPQLIAGSLIPTIVIVVASVIGVI